MKPINKKQFNHKDLNAARKRGVISGLIWAIDLAYKEQRKASKYFRATNANDIIESIQKALDETRGPIKL